MNIKKWIPILISLLIFCISCSVNADDQTKFVSKDGSYEYRLREAYGKTGTFNVADLRSYFGKEIIVRVPETIDGYPVYYLNGTFKDDPITKVYLPDSVILIDNLFSENTKIEEIEIIGNGFDGGSIFEACTSLKKAIISGCNIDNPLSFFIGFSRLENFTTLEVSGNIETADNLYENIKEISFSGSIDDLAISKSTQLETITLPEKVNRISENCFQYCYNLKTINYGGSLCQWKELIKSVDTTWLENVTINCAKGDNHSYGTPTIIKKATCKETGLKETVCKNCGDKITETIPISKTHTYGEWNITKEATFTSAGSQEHTCSVCGKKETKTIKKLVLKAGLIFEDPASGCKYKVLGGKSKVCCLAPLNKKVISVTIPDTVSYNGIKFKVSEIGNKAFSGCSDLVIVNLGKNISSIGSYAFNNCGMLCRIYVRSTALNKVGAKALMGTDSDLIIRVPKKKLTAYKKLFNKKGQSKDTKIQVIA